MRVAAATALLLTLVTQPQTAFADETGYFGLLRGRDLSPFGGSPRASLSGRNDGRAQECPPVMSGLAARARALLDPSGSRRITIGPCTTVTDEGACQGTLYATVRRDDDPRPSVIYCDGGCEFVRESHEWMRFGREYLRERRLAG